MISAFAAVALSGPILSIQSDEPRLLRFPTVHGDQVAFTYAGDLWVANRTTNEARRLTSSPGLEIRPKFSPDGKTIAFTAAYDGNFDVYTIPTAGGEPTRLTWDPESDLSVGWTPDGKVAYATTGGSFTNRQARLALVKPTGGLPEATPIAEVSEASFYADGSGVAYTRVNSYNYNWRRYRGGTQGRISFFDFRNGTYAEIPTGREQNYFPMVAKGDIFYISDRDFGTLNLYRYNPRSRQIRRLTEFRDADIRFPSTDGETIVYERDGYLYAYAIDSGQVSRLTPNIRGENIWSRPYVRNFAREYTDFSLSPSGLRLAVEARGELFSVPARQGDTRNLTDTPDHRERMPRWSPDGKTIAYVSDATGEYEIYLRPQQGGDARKLTNESGLAFTDIRWAPDSKYLVASTSAREIAIIDAVSGSVKKLPMTQSGMALADISPDSRWLAYLQLSTGFPRIMLYEVATGESKPVTSGMYQDSSATFDLNGKYLYFTSLRTFTPSFGAYEFSLKVGGTERVYAIPLTKALPNPMTPPNDEEPDAPARPAGPPPGPPPGGPPPGPGGPPPGGPPAPAAPATPPGIAVDFDGIESRAFPLPWAPGSFFAIVGVNNGVLAFTPSGVNRFDFASRESTPILPIPVFQFDLNPNRTKLAFSSAGTLSVVDVRPGLQPGQGRVDLAGLQFTLNPRAEWRQMFWETWRYMRDNFYDPGMRGQDWNAIGRRYAAYLPYVNHRSDLSYVLGLMIGELGTGHAYVQGGDVGPNAATFVPVGMLGVDYEASGDAVRFKRILRGNNYDESMRAPLGEPGIDVKDGDYLLAIDGQAVNATTHPASRLQGKAGRYVTLTVNDKPSLEGSRKVRVRTLASETTLRYVDFVDGNRRKVEELSGGRVGYFHVPDTAFQGSIEFIRGFYRNNEKDALLVDERWNGGGFIQPWYVQTLARRAQAGIQGRTGLDERDQIAIEGPKAILINAYAGSGGDFFPWLFRQAKLGPLVGTRTWGGLVGISGGAPLVDGGSVTAPAFSIYDLNSFDIVAENTGVDPDIEVDARPDLWAKGRDPQLEAGVKYLMDQLAKLPPKKQRTRVPEVGPKGRVGG